MLKNASIQEYLSIGYVLLVLLGVVSESIYFGLLGIHYLQYASILDVLISPISLLSFNWILLVALFLFGLFFIFMTKRMPKIHEKNKHKKWYQRIQNVEKLDKSLAKNKNKDNKGALSLLVILLVFSMLIGFRIGMASKYKSYLNKASFKNDYTLIFNDNTKLNVKKIGQNSMYIFYVLEGEKEVTATPIADNIKQIKKIHKKK